MFGLVSKKKYNVLIEHNNMLIKEVDNLKVCVNSGFWYIQTDKDTFKCSNCGHITTFSLHNIPDRCPECEKEMIALKNDPKLKQINPEVEELRKENKKLKNKISSMKMDIDGLEENRQFYEDKYRNLCDVMREIHNGLSDENDQIPDKCPDCGSGLFYDPIGHYGMCLKCGKNYNMSKIWQTLKDKKPIVPCKKCKFKIEYENNKKKEE